MDKLKMQHLRGWFVWFIAVIAIGAIIVFGGPLSAASQLILSIVSVIVVGMAVLMGCYEAPRLGERLVVSRPGKSPKVVRVGTFIFPLMSWTTRVRLTSMWIKFPKDAKGDGSAILSRENRLITKDGLPVTTRVELEIEVGDNDASILNVAQNFSDRSDSEIEDYFTKILAGIVAKVVAETNFLDLREKHDELEDKVHAAAKLKVWGYQVGRILSWPIGQLSIDDAGLQGGDALRAKRVLEDLEGAERLHEISRDTKIESSAHELEKTRKQNAEEQGKLEQKKEEVISKRRIEKELAVGREELRRDTELSKERAAKLHQEVQTEQTDQKYRLALAETAKQERILAAEASYEEKMVMLQLAVKQQEEALKLRGEELMQNMEKQGGDLDYVLKKEAIQASATAAKDLAGVLSAALSKADITFVGDAGAAGELTRDYAKSIAIGSRIKGLISLLNDVHVHDAIGSLRQIWNEAGASKPFTTANDREPTGNDFEP
jgi:energy-coupling factor transporter ATP-binding protein EcfA2